MKVKGKVILVTGGGSGIGRALVLNLLSRDASVATIDINQAGLDDTVQLAGEAKDRLSTYVVDITDLSAVEALPEKIIAQHGVIDGLINNAGIIQPFVRVKDLSFDAIQRVMNVNFFGTVNMTKTFLPYLLERPEAHILNMSSMGSYAPVPGQMGAGAPPRGGAGRSRRGPESADEDTPVHPCWGCLTRPRGCKVPYAVSPTSRGRGHAQAFTVGAGPRIPGVDGESSREAETQERIDRRLGETRADAHGLAGGGRLRGG